jgi:hypothetical protein
MVGSCTVPIATSDGVCEIESELPEVSKRLNEELNIFLPNNWNEIITLFIFLYTFLVPREDPV